MGRHARRLPAGDMAGGHWLMWLTVGKGAIELLFEHTHELPGSRDGRRHRHDLARADPEAHLLAHRLSGAVTVSSSRRKGQLL